MNGSPVSDHFDFNYQRWLNIEHAKEHAKAIQIDDHPPLAYVHCYTRDGIRTTVVTCYSPAAILYAVEMANDHDSIHIRVN